MFEFRFRDGQRAFLRLDVVAGKGELRLSRSHLDISRSGLGDHRYEQRVVVLDRHVQVGRGRLDAATITTPDVDFPVGIETGRPLVLNAIDWEAAPNESAESGRRGAELCASVRAKRFLRLREESTDGHTAHRAGLDHSHARGTQVQILLVGGRHQFIQLRVVEDFPPGGVVRLLALDVFVVSVDPGVLSRGGGTTVLRTHFKAVVIPVLEW